MGKVFKYMILGVMGLVLTGCPPNCEYSLVNFGTLSDEVLEMIPYEDGESYGFRHSEGEQLSFLATRETSMISNYWDECTEVTYASDYTIMVPDYPLFDIRIWIYKADSTRVLHQAIIGTSSFILPLTEEPFEDFYQFYDSIYLQEKWFSDVYEIEPLYSPYQNPKSILADTLWFNTEFGILKFTMTSGEYYEIMQDK